MLCCLCILHMCSYFLADDYNWKEETSTSNAIKLNARFGLLSPPLYEYEYHYFSYLHSTNSDVLAIK